MDTRVALSVAFSLVVLVASLPNEADVRVRRRADPPWARLQNNFQAPGRGNNKFTGQGNYNKGPPGLAGGGPPGLAGGGPPGLNKPGKWKPNYDVYDNYGPSWDDKPDNTGGNPALTSGRPPGDTGQSCKKNEFRCGSNECLPGTVRCDNKFDCRDSSDEHGCVTKPVNEAGCVLPGQPKGGSYELGGCGKPCSKRTGDKVPSNSILTYTCQSNYILHGSTVSVCANDTWHNLPSCLKTCRGLKSTTVNILCTYLGDEVSCTERVKPRTVATLSCKSSYKLHVTNEPVYRTVTCLRNGKWNRRIFRCLPECGIPISRGNTLVVNGSEAELGLFPWHVGIYDKKPNNTYEQICGGSLISNNLVVSAAHCFYDESVKKVRDKSHFAVAAGKQYRDWNANEIYMQKLPVAEIMLPERYIGFRGNYAEDIALIKLASPFNLSMVVRPICMDWDNAYERQQLQVGHSGKSAGWGLTITGDPSESLQELTMPFVPYDQCSATVPNDFQGFITSDKFCAGRLDNSSFCHGDSGGGLCFDMNGTWYLRGIVSVSPLKGIKCDFASYVVFTSTGKFQDWIRNAYGNA